MKTAHSLQADVATRITAPYQDAPVGRWAIKATDTASARAPAALGLGVGPGTRGRAQGNPQSQATDTVV